MHSTTPSRPYTFASVGDNARAVVSRNRSTGATRRDDHDETRHRQARRGRRARLELELAGLRISRVVLELVFPDRSCSILRLLLHTRWAFARYVVTLADSRYRHAIPNPNDYDEL